MIHERRCRVCDSELVSVLDFGMLRLSDFMAEKNYSAPLDLCRCQVCGLVQLRHTVTPDQLFKKYWYLSGINETMREELRDVVGHALGLVDMKSGDIVIDVGANDGTLLAQYPCSLTRVAYEPAENLQQTLRQHCEMVFDSYFPGQPGLISHDSAKIITSIACFYAVDDPIAFVRAVDNLLTRDGIWIVQFQDLHQMLHSTAFDDICHEHLFYPCLASVERLLEPYDLKIIDAQQRRINGGSLRLTIGRRYRSISPNVATLRAKEFGCEHPSTLRNFVARVHRTTKKIRAIVHDACNAGLVVDLYGASTKGNTLLQVCNLGPDLIRQAWERSPAKIGGTTVTGIPIVSEQLGRADPPNLLLVGIWQFRDAVIARESSFIAAGGRLIFPLPTVEVINVAEVRMKYVS